MPKKHRTQEELRALFVEWVNRLNLLHWTFDLVLSEDEVADDDEPQDGQEATIYVADDYNRATVKFRKNGWKYELSDKELERIIAHELIHCHLESLYTACTHVSDVLPEGARELYMNRALHELEAATDALATSMVRTLGANRDAEKTT